MYCRFRHIYMSLLFQLRGSRSNYTPVTTSTFSSAILVSNTILQEKEQMLLEEMAEMADSRERTR